jgi:SNF2 family DNA or RNA helicase
MKFERTLLLTGTPIQNNLSELFALLHFIMPKQFKDLSKFLSWFSPLSEDGRKSKKLNDADLAKVRNLLSSWCNPNSVFLPTARDPATRLHSSILTSSN